MNVLVVDNLDSFTYMLVDYLRQAGANCRVVRNNEPMSRLTAGRVDAVVLSPGPGRPRQAGRLMAVIDHYHRRVPMLGVCLGHQALGEFFGASLVPAARPMHGKVSAIRLVADDVLTRGLPARFDVTRYHSLLLTNEPGAGSPLVSLAVTDQNELMAMRHRTLPLWGVQFHPEAALTENGLLLLVNWINYLLVSEQKNDSAVSLTAQCA